MYIRWQVEDGYTGPNRPHSFNLDERELEGLAPEETEEYINKSIQEEFEQHISWIRLDSA